MHVPQDSHDPPPHSPDVHCWFDKQALPNGRAPNVIPQPGTVVLPHGLARSDDAHSCKRSMVNPVSGSASACRQYAASLFLHHENCTSHPQTAAPYAAQALACSVSSGGRSASPQALARMRAASAADDSVRRANLIVRS